MVGHNRSLIMQLLWCSCTACHLCQ